MQEHIVLDLLVNLDGVELDGMPAWVDSGIYQLTRSPPAEQRFVPGLDALIYAQRNNSRFMYVGVVRNVHVDRASNRLIFDSFERFKRPVMIHDEHIPDEITDKVHPADKGFFREFAYIDAGRFQEAIRQSQRPAEPVPVPPQ